MILVYSWLFVIAFADICLAGEPLTNDVIERWLKSQQELVAWGNKHKERMDHDSSNGIPRNASDMLAPVKAAGLYGELGKILEKYGFSQPEKWADVSIRIIGALGAIQVGDSMKGVDIQAQINQIQNTEGMSAAQKQQMIQMMQQSMNAMQQMASASEADIAIVKPYVSKIESVLNAN
jgi:Holliday junction resolvasome RuvABC endonuclease subunit